MKSLVSSSKVRVFGFTLAFLLAGASVSNAFFFRWPRLFGITFHDPLPLLDVYYDGGVGEAQEPNQTKFHKIYVNCLIHKAVASGSGYTNNMTPNLPSVFINNNDVNGALNEAISPFTCEVCDKDAWTIFSVYKVAPDATPEDNYDQQAFASIYCIAKLVPKAIPD